MRRVFLMAAVFALLISLSPAQVYVQRGNLWDACLERNYECLLMLFKDGTLIVSSVHSEYIVVIPWEAAFANGRKPGDLLVIIHNHIGIGRWSDMDRDTNKMFRRRGYLGPILLRLGNGECIEWED